MKNCKHSTWEMTREVPYHIGNILAYTTCMLLCDNCKITGQTVPNEDCNIVAVILSNKKKVVYMRDEEASPSGIRRMTLAEGLNYKWRGIKRLLKRIIFYYKTTSIIFTIKMVIRERKRRGGVTI